MGNTTMTSSQPDITVATARDTVEDETARPQSLRRAAWQLFDAGRFELARRGFERLVASGESDPDIVTALQQIYADRQEFGNVALLLDRYLHERGSDLSPDERLGWLAARFDALVAGDSSPDLSRAALQLLEAAAAAGPQGWDLVLDPTRRSALDGVLLDPSIALNALEQFLYAPPQTGLPAQALLNIEEFGCRHAADRDLSRAAERLLHAFGDPAAAYRVEACRRAIALPAAPTQAAPPAARQPPRRLLTVTIAGGHPALRSLARRDLETIGVADVREIPPAWEATRHGRAIQATLGGSDLVVVIGSQIAHTTFDQVRTAAVRLGIPIVTTPSATMGAIHRAVDQFVFEETRG
jgi:hypothetical protein